MPLGKSEVIFTFFLFECFLIINKVNAKRTRSVDVVSTSMYDGRQNILFFRSDMVVFPSPKSIFVHTVLQTC